MKLLSVPSPACKWFDKYCKSQCIVSLRKFVGSEEMEYFRRRFNRHHLQSCNGRLHLYIFCWNLNVETLSFNNASHYLSAIIRAPLQMRYLYFIDLLSVQQFWMQFKTCMYIVKDHKQGVWDRYWAERKYIVLDFKESSSPHLALSCLC